MAKSLQNWAAHSDRAVRMWVSTTISKSPVPCYDRCRILVHYSIIAPLKGTLTLDYNQPYTGNISLESLFHSSIIPLT